MRKYERTGLRKMKRHADSVWYVKPSTIKEDEALVKRDETNKKNDTPYNTTPSIKFDKKGSMVTTEAQDAALVTRKSSFFKTVPIAGEENASTEEQEDCIDAVAPRQSDDTPPRRYLQSVHTRPVTLDDYVCY